MFLTFLKKYYVYMHNPFNKVIKFIKRKRHITHHHTHNGVHAFCHIHVKNLLKWPAES